MAGERNLPRGVDEVEVIPQSLRNLVVGIINCFRPLDDQIQYTGVYTKLVSRELTERELAEMVMELFDEPWVIH